MHRIGKYTASIILDIFTASGGILAAFSISSVLLIAPSPQIIYKSSNRMLCCRAACLRPLPGCLPLCPSPAARAVSAIAVPLSAAAAPLPGIGGQARPQDLQSSSTRLRYDPVVEDDFALS